MANREANSQWQNCDNYGNGLSHNDCDDNLRRGTVDRKRKSKQLLFMNENDYRLRLQEALYSSEYILTKIFRKDGPPLGVDFDSIPSNAFLCDPRKSHHQENRRARKRRKISTQPTIVGSRTSCYISSPAQRHGIGKGLMTEKCVPTKKHGMGKGLMNQNGAPWKTHGIGKGLTVVNNSEAREFLLGADIGGSRIQKKKKGVQRREPISRILANKAPAKKKTSMRGRKVECKKFLKQNPCKKEKCGLAIGDIKCLENTEEFARLLDDEELELRELRAGPNPLSCSDHFSTNGSHGCSLCKDLLAKFPPNFVTMKLPLFTQPWASSPELVNKLFKAFHFLCTYAVAICIRSFTFDEFAQAFHDKDSLLLGQVHLALLKLLLTDIGMELDRGFPPHASKNCKFLSLLHSLEHHGVALELWKKSLNPLTWTEILRQVLVEAGFGSKLGMTSKESCNKEANVLERYGLTPGSLKGELFSILFNQGSSGMQVSELAKSSSIVEMNLTDTCHDLENLITSALTGDITLFEKISSSGYRLRIHAAAKECEVCPSDSEDFGSIDEIGEVTGGRYIANDSEYNSEDSRPSECDLDDGLSNNTMLIVCDEIDESHSGEAWLLGLMEGEYSDLSIEEKLNTLTSLIDLLSAGSSIRMEDRLMSRSECPPNVNHYGSGAKIKRSTAKQCNSLRVLGGCGGQTLCGFEVNTSEQPIDSLVPMSKVSEEEKHANMKKIAEQMEEQDLLHPMQSIFLRSDRRYNRYWLFLGPCDEFDPGHKRIYFESSEDGHWEMIDSHEAICTLMSLLDRRGAREARLLAALERYKAFLCQATSAMPNGANMQPPQFSQSESNTSREDSSSPVSDVDNRLGLSEIQNDLPPTGVAIVEAGKKVEHHEKSGRSQAFDAWIWKSFYSALNTVKSGKKSYLDSLRRCDHCHDLYWRDEKHCRICHTTFELDLDLEERYAVHSAVCQANRDVNKCRKQRVLSSQLQALKAAIYAIESVIPEDAFLGSWRRSTHNLWVNRLRRASCLTEYLQVLADFVTAINEDWFYQNGISGSCNVFDEIFSNFSTTPQTYSAVALWLVKLDLLVASHVECGLSQSK